MAVKGKMISITIKPDPMPFKFVMGDCWRNISYKKAIRMANKRVRRMLISNVKKFEEATGFSRYDVYFNRVQHRIWFTIIPIPQHEPEKMTYRFSDDRK